MEALPLEDRASAADPERVVVECCAAGTPAVVTFGDGESGLRAVFASFRNERIGLEMTDDPSTALPSGTACHVSFLHRGRPVVFTAPLRTVERDGGRVLVHVSIPGQITSDGIRSAFRIPGGRPRPQVELVTDDAVAWEAELVDASLTGMFLRFPGEAPSLMPDQVVEIAVQVSNEELRLAGIVRRIEEDGVGVFFPDAVAATPENPVRRVVAVLERSWHARLRR